MRWAFLATILLSECLNAFLVPQKREIRGFWTNVWAKSASSGSSSERSESPLPDVPQQVMSPTLQELFGKKSVSLLGTSDLESREDDYPLIFKESSFTQEGPPIEIPLMPFPNPLFPGGREFLYIYEMRFRTLMNDAEQSGGVLGRCFISNEGALGKVGCWCKIVEQRRLEDGKGFFIVESMERFKIVRITQRTPYLVAEVRILHDDPHTQQENEVNEILCVEVYALLKTYLRLARHRAEVAGLGLDVDGVEVLDPVDRGEGGSDGVGMGGMVLDEGTEDTVRDGLHDEDWEDYEEIEYDIEGEMGISVGVRDFRPQAAGPDEPDSGALRHKSFSYAVANLLSTDPSIMQIILQERSTAFRLHGLKRILIEAVAELGTALVEDGILTQSDFDQVRRRGEALDDDDSDLMPPKDFEGMTLRSELSASLVQQLGLGPADQLVAAEVNEEVLSRGFVDDEGEIAGTGGVTEEEEDDIWSGAGAFQ